ncbi:hypothetical protein KAS42_05505 [bacterium]|nr:hypothetical protein [bacterium]
MAEWKKNRKLSQTQVFIISAIFGFCILALLPIVTGHNNPFDVEDKSYFVVLIVGGFILGMLAPRYLAVCYLGVWLGQVLAIEVLPGIDKAWWMLGVLTFGILSILVLVGAFIGSIIINSIEPPEKK